MTADDTIAQYRWKWRSGGLETKCQDQSYNKEFDHQRTTRRKESFSALTLTTPQCSMANLRIFSTHNDLNCPTIYLTDGKDRSIYKQQ